MCACGAAVSSKKEGGVPGCLQTRNKALKRNIKKNQQNRILRDCAEPLGLNTKGRGGLKWENMVEQSAEENISNGKC